MLAVRDGDRKRLGLHNVVGRKMRAEIDHDLVSRTHSSPRRIHCVGISVLVIGADYQHRLRCQKGINAKIFTHSNSPLQIFLFDYNIVSQTEQKINT